VGGGYSRRGRFLRPHRRSAGVRSGTWLSTVLPYAASGVSATIFKIGTGLYLIVIAMLSLSIGGYFAVRLRTGWVGVHSDEVYFRDTTHGFIASVLGAVLLASPGGSLNSGGASGAMQGAAAAGHGGPMDGYLDALLRSDTPASPTAGNSSEFRGEMLRLFASSFQNGGELKPGDREYVSKVVAARSGLSQTDADKRVRRR
jgi:hypothetical protein